MRISTSHFEEASPEHTEAVLERVQKFLEANPEIETILVATTEGSTGLAAARTFSSMNVIVVTHQSGFVTPNENELLEGMHEAITKSGATVLTCTHAFAGIGRSLRKSFGTWSIPEIFAIAYRTFGQGTKVCAEIAMMAADAGLVRVDNDVICIGGTGRGADTAWVVRPAYTSSFSELKMRACICRPIEF